MRHLALAVAFTSVASLGVLAQAPKSVPPSVSKATQYGYTVVRSYPHDPKAYTQGLEYFDGFLYEGTGMKGNSAVRKVELETGIVAQETKMHPQYFGEGITIAQGKVFQLTWQDRAGFVYEAKTLSFIRNFSYFGEGWGLTHDPAGLVMISRKMVAAFVVCWISSCVSLTADWANPVETMQTDRPSA